MEIYVFQRVKRHLCDDPPPPTKLIGSRVVLSVEFGHGLPTNEGHNHA